MEDNYIIRRHLLPMNPSAEWPTKEMAPITTPLPIFLNSVGLRTRMSGRRVGRIGEYEQLGWASGFKLRFR